MVRTREQNLLQTAHVFVSPVPQEVVRLVELDEEGAFRGFRIQTDLRRVYPQADAASRLLGHTSPAVSWEEYERLRAAFQDEITPATRLGRTGIEHAYDAHLRGRPGRQRLGRDEHGAFSVVLEEAPPAPGFDVELALSVEACRTADEALERHGAPEGYYLKTRPSGALVAIDAETGEIYAVGELPRFDPTEDWFGGPDGPKAVADRERGDWVPGERVVLGIDEKHLALQIAKATALDPSPLFDLEWRTSWVPDADPPEGMDLAAWRRTLSEPLGMLTSRVYQAPVAPGSTLKPFVGLAMLESGPGLPYAWFHCRGDAGHPRCHPHPDVDFEDALATSCNQFFAYSLRDSAHWPVFRTSVASFLDRLGFGHETGSDLVGERRGEWLRREEWGEGQQPTILRDDGRQVAIGQGPVLATPLQMARAAAALANGGRLVTPHAAALVGGTPVTSPSTDLRLSPAALARVREGMRRAVAGDVGTARRAGFSRVRAEVWGKTGTAQVGTAPCAWMPWPSPLTATHHWFIGFAKAPGRRTIAFAAVLHARTESAAADTAAPAVADFLAWWFDREGAP
jgi:cell division protein FtsI/penicillin-binding protein 2